MPADKLTAISEMFRVYHSALDVLESRIDGEFDEGVSALAGHDGTVIVCGWGKSGLGGRHIYVRLCGHG